MAKLHLIEGPVGAGKSTYAFKLGLEQRTPVLVLDDWMARLFSPDRPDEGVMEWYGERKERCIEQIWVVTTELLERGIDVILELGLVQRRQRWAFYERLESADIAYAVHVLDAPRDIRRERVKHRNIEQGATFSMVGPDAIFELASDFWEPPDELECEGRDMQFPTTISLMT